jgi:glutamyl-tRNA reductase
MQIAALGLNHNTAPIEIRELIATPKNKFEDLYRKILSNEQIYEVLILSTCNRVEIYYVTDDLECNKSFIIETLIEGSNLKADLLNKYLYYYCDNEAIRHLISVASGIDSMVVGEPQIFGQVKEAFKMAREFGNFSNFLKKLEIITYKATKKIRSHTGISENPVTISYAAIQMAKKLYGSLANKSALIIGAGTMCELAAKHLARSESMTIYIANRTLEKAENLANEVKGKALEFDKFFSYLASVDIVISGAASEHYIIKYEHIINKMAERKHKPIFFIDIAVPRNIDPLINNIDNVYVYDIDDLKSVVEANKKAREKEIIKAHTFIEDAVRDYNNWADSLNIKPVIIQLKSYFDEIKRQELSKYTHKFKISDDEIIKIERIMAGYTNKLLHKPLVNIKVKGVKKDKYSLVEAVELLFNLKDE